MYTVYKHTAPSGKVYIGITSRKPEKRWRGGAGYINNDHFAKAINKYGWENIVHEILYVGLTKEEAEQKEIELISKHRSDNRKFGYNIQHGGSSRGKHAEESKKKIGAANKGRAPWCKGKHHKEETKRKIAKAKIGSKLSLETKEKISMAHKGIKQAPEVIEKRANANRGKKRTEEQRKHISESKIGLKGVTHTEDTKKKIAAKLSKPIIQIETGTIYKSIRSAGRELNIGSGSITECLKGRLKTAGGYHWEYVTNSLSDQKTDDNIILSEG